MEARLQQQAAAVAELAGSARGSGFFSPTNEPLVIGCDASYRYHEGRADFNVHNRYAQVLSDAPVSCIHAQWMNAQS